MYQLVRPFLFMLPAETAHNFSVAALEFGFGAFFARNSNHDMLRSTVCGLEFSNPVGLAAGYDKDARIYDAILRLGFGFTEVGTLTPKPQDGNPKPRLFRLRNDEAVINRMGFNNAGIEAAKKRLYNRDRSRGIVGINVGANKDSDDRINDYSIGIKELGEYADYLVVNISSPNTPDLRKLQSADALGNLLGNVINARNSLPPPKKPPLFVKVAPDLSDSEIKEMAHIIRASKADGIIISNTTISRPDTLQSDTAEEAGGLSGAPLLSLSTDILRKFYQQTEGSIPLIGVGGIGSGEDAYAKIRAGASLVQIYSRMVYEGPQIVHAINRSLVTLLQKDGFSHITEAIGKDC